MNNEKNLSPWEESILNENRLESNKELVEGGAEVNEDNQIIVTGEQIEKSKESMDAILKAKNRILEINKDLDNFSKEDKNEAEFKALSLEFTELQKFLSSENESGDKLSMEIEEIQEKILNIKEIL